MATALKRILIVALLVLINIEGGAAAEAKRVMLLHSFGRDFKPWSEYSRAIRVELGRRAPWPIDITDHSLISARFAGENTEQAFADYLRTLFEQQPLDLIISLGAPAAGFVQRHRKQSFPKTPMVITAVDRRRVDHSSLTANDTVVAVDHDFRASIKNIISILPATTLIAIVNGASPLEQIWKKEIQRQIEPYADQVTFRWYDELSFEDLLKDAASLPPNSAIFWPISLATRPCPVMRCASSSPSPR